MSEVKNPSLEAGEVEKPSPKAGKKELKMPQKRPKHLNGGLSSDNILKTQPGDNARFLRAARVSMSLPPIDISDPKQVEDRINQYFDYCVQNDLKPGFVMMANWLGVNRDTLNQWKRGIYRAGTHTAIIQKAVNQLEALWETYMLEGKVNIVAGIFIGKQYYGAVDKQEITITPNENSTAPLTAEEISKRLPDPEAEYEVD